MKLLTLLITLACAPTLADIKASDFITVKLKKQMAVEACVTSLLNLSDADIAYLFTYSPPAYKDKMIPFFITNFTSLFAPGELTSIEAIRLARKCTSLYR